MRILGEDRVLFRDRSGKLGLIDRVCPHRHVNVAIWPALSGRMEFIEYAIQHYASERDHRPKWMAERVRGGVGIRIVQSQPAVRAAAPSVGRPPR